MNSWGSMEPLPSGSILGQSFSKACANQPRAWSKATPVRPYSAQRDATAVSSAAVQASSVIGLPPVCIWRILRNSPLSSVPEPRPRRACGVGGARRHCRAPGDAQCGSGGREKQGGGATCDACACNAANVGSGSGVERGRPQYCYYQVIVIRLLLLTSLALFHCYRRRQCRRPEPHSYCS